MSMLVKDVLQTCKELLFFTCFRLCDEQNEFIPVRQKLSISKLIIEGLLFLNAVSSYYF